MDALNGSATVSYLNIADVEVLRASRDLVRRLLKVGSLA